MLLSLMDSTHQNRQYCYIGCDFLFNNYVNSFSISLDMLKTGFNQQLHHEYNKKAISELVNMKIHFTPTVYTAGFISCFIKDKFANNNL